MPGASADEIIYTEGFSFNEEVASCFDNMLERSIPDYFGMREMTRLITSRYANAPWHTVVDVGSSIGESFKPYVDSGCRVISIEPSEAMLSRQKERYNEAGNIEYINDNAENALQTVADGSVDLFVFCLTLQFIGKDSRDGLVEAAFRKLKRGGAIVIVQKDKTDAKAYDDLVVEKYYAMKIEHGYSVESVETKKRALNGYMEIDTIAETETRLSGAGFSSVNEYWRALNFSGFIAVKQ